MKMVSLLISVFLLFTTGCDAPDADNGGSRAPVTMGADRIAAGELDLFRGKRVGLITNHSAVVGDRHLIDVLHESDDVSVVALFGPEHGIRGDADAGARIDHGVDERTGAPVYSLYGEIRRPTPQMLRNVDVLAFDIQDIGARFYTYISTMGYGMQAAAEQGIPFVVLDRPNPLGGLRAQGFILEPQYESFVGLYEIPITHGLTVGELARMIQGEGLLSGLENLDLHVVEVKGWRRSDLWPATGHEWIPPSPNIPNFETALIYPGACFFEGTSASEGRGTYEPFILLGAPWADGEALADQLNGYNLPGLRFEPVEFTPESIQGMAASPKLLGRQLSGIRYVVTDAQAVRPVEAGVYVLSTFYHQAPDEEQPGFFREASMRRLAGTDRLHTAIVAGSAPEEIVEAWQDEVEAFNERRRPYLLYD